MQQHLKNIQYNRNDKKKIDFYIFNSEEERKEFRNCKLEDMMYRSINKVLESDPESSKSYKDLIEEEVNSLLEYEGFLEWWEDTESGKDWIYETQIELKGAIEIGTFSKDGRKLKELAFRRFFERQLIIA